MQLAAFEVIDPRNVRQPDLGESSAGEDEELGAPGFSVTSGHGPPLLIFVVRSSLDAGIQLNLRAQLETVRHVLEVGENLFLRRIPLRPFPFLLEIFREGV
ncbi:hypothetical protein D3C87_1371840 [compost metagenome]